MGVTKGWLKLAPYNSSLHKIKLTIESWIYNSTLSFKQTFSGYGLDQLSHVLTTVLPVFVIKEMEKNRQIKAECSVVLIPVENNSRVTTR